MFSHIFGANQIFVYFHGSLAPMKTVCTYLLAALLMLNVLGYYGVFVGLQYKNSRDIALRLDRDYNNVQGEITIKVPLSVPYMNDLDYRRVDGDFEYEGEFYKMVKQKFSHDTLHIVCVRNETGKQINTALADYVKTFTDQPTNTGSQGKTLFSFIKDFIGTSLDLEPSVNGYVHVYEFQSYNQFSVLSSDMNYVGPPPRG